MVDDLVQPLQPQQRTTAESFTLSLSLSLSLSCSYRLLLGMSHSPSGSKLQCCQSWVTLSVTHSSIALGSRQEMSDVACHSFYAQLSQSLGCARTDRELLRQGSDSFLFAGWGHPLKPHAVAFISVPSMERATQPSMERATQQDHETRAGPVRQNVVSNQS